MCVYTCILFQISIIGYYKILSSSRPLLVCCVVLVVCIYWRRKWQPTQVFLPRKSHRQKSLAGYSLCGLRRVGHGLATQQQQQMCIYKFQTANLSLSLPTPPLVSISSFSMSFGSVSLFLFCKEVHLYHFLRFHI